MLLKDWMEPQENQLRGLSQNIIYHQIQFPKHLKSLWKSFLTSFGRNSIIQNKTEPYGYCPRRLLTPDALNGNTYAWNCLYSQPKTPILGFVACQVDSISSGIESVEISWSDVKQLKAVKCSNLGGSSVEMRAILLTSSKLRKSNIGNQGKLEGSNYFDDDVIRWVI